MSPRHRAAVASCLLSLLAAVGSAAETTLDRAAAHVARADYAQAVAELESTFAAGFETPSLVLADRRFAPLREDGPSRARLRRLLGDHVRESAITIVGANEPGAPMVVRGRVLSTPDGEPIVGARIEIFHTDAGGRYQPGDGVDDDDNARLFGFVRTDADGRFEVRTIEPGPYPGLGPGAAHVHFRISAPGYAGYGAEFRPYDHPRTAEERATSLERGWRSSQVHREEDVLVCEVMIPMRPSDGARPPSGGRL